MNILSVASEVFPLVKTGGLADVVGALPPALAAHGVSTTVLMPAYRGLISQMRKRRKRHGYADFFGGAASIVSGGIAGLDLMLLDAPHLFDREGHPYADANGADWPDNWKRFAALARAGADIARGMAAGYRPDLVHAHDWQAALTLAYMRFDGQATPSVMTVHNLAFQGQFDASIFPELGLPPGAFSMDGVEYYGGVGYLKAGLQAARAITTVSPTYAQEIRTPQFGMGLDGLLNGRRGDLHGILNGIDTTLWDPARDERLASNYDARSLSGRRANRQALEARFALDLDGGPIVCVISRLTWQKGMDILMAMLDGLVALGVKFAVLGSGDAALEGAFLAAAARHRGRVGVVIGYDETLSHLLQGGADAILIPSRFEPCGLTQLYGLRYGCVPVVARTGGLADTVIDANEAAVSAGAATGFQFAPGNADELLDAVSRVRTVYEDGAVWSSLQRQGMKTDVSWDKSAARYADLYRSLLSKG